MLRPPALASVLPLVLLACNGPRFDGPLGLIGLRSGDCAVAPTGPLATGGETRLALLASGCFRTPLPARPLLTFGMGGAWSGDGEAPGWYRLVVRAGDRVLVERTLNPRAARGWRDVSVPIQGLGHEATLHFDLRFADRDGKPIPQPPGLLLGVAEPTVHDLDAYGRSKGILLVSIDTLRRDHVGVYGYARPTTPTLDVLARSSILCEDAVSTSSWTLPAHLSLLTSVDPGAHGGVDMNHGFNHKVPTLTATLRAAGYATHAVTSHLYVSSVYGLDDGFDSLDFHQDRKATESADKAIALLDRFGDRPFFLFLHLYDPHWHYDPPERTLRLFETAYSGNVTGVWQDFSNRRNLSAADLQHLLALYDGEIRYADEEVGRVLEHLRARGLDRGTLVVATSDHGEEFQDHGSWEHQKTLYEEVVRIPLMIGGPGIPARREPAQVSLLDVAPTILAWAGLQAPPSFMGRSLLGTPGEREAYGETDHTTDGTRKLFLRAGSKRWKAIISLDPQGGLRRQEWYDLAVDPQERTSTPPRVALAEPIRVRAVERWKQARGRGEGSAAVCLTAEQKERLRALGYVGPLGSAATCPAGK